MPMPTCNPRRDSRWIVVADDVAVVDVAAVVLPMFLVVFHLLLWRNIRRSCRALRDITRGAESEGSSNCSVGKIADSGETAGQRLC